VVSAPLAVLVGETVPQVGEHAVPFWVRVHVTPALLLSLLTVAVNCSVVLICKLAVVGETEIVMAGTLIVAAIDLVGSATEVAVTVTARSLAGDVTGAV
jgi:hypothetical protein